MSRSYSSDFSVAFIFSFVPTLPERLSSDRGKRVHPGQLVMRPIRWLHISDFHIRVSEAWSQDVVLSAMCEGIAQQRRQNIKVDFILV